MELVQNGVRISGQTESTASILLVRYDSQIQNVNITSGENSGETLPHYNVVKEITRIGYWEGGLRVFYLPRNQLEDEMNEAVLVQRGMGGPILGAAHVAGNENVRYSRTESVRDSELLDFDMVSAGSRDTSSWVELGD